MYTGSSQAKDPFLRLGEVAVKVAGVPRSRGEAGGAVESWGLGMKRSLGCSGEAPSGWVEGVLGSGE